MNQPPIVIVVAMGRNRELGKDGRLLWHIPEDLQRFKRLTSGHPVILGRKTFESIVGYLGKPLPNRTNIVVTRDPAWTHEQVVVARSLEEALEKARALNPAEIHVGGGAQIYEQILPQVDKLFLTLVEDEPAADTFFPEAVSQFTKIVGEELREHNGLTYRWLDLER